MYNCGIHTVIWHGITNEEIKIAHEKNSTRNVVAFIMLGDSLKERIDTAYMNSTKSMRKSKRGEGKE